LKKGHSVCTMRIPWLESPVLKLGAKGKKGQLGVCLGKHFSGGRRTVLERLSAIKLPAGLQRGGRGTGNTSGNRSREGKEDWATPRTAT